MFCKLMFKTSTFNINAKRQNDIHVFLTSNFIRINCLLEKSRYLRGHPVTMATKNIYNLALMFTTTST